MSDDYQKNYLAYTAVGMGGVWGYGRNELEAVYYLLTELGKWSSTYKVNDKEIDVGVYDAKPWSRFHFDGGYVSGLKNDGDKSTPLTPVSIAHIQTPKRSFGKQSCMTQALKTLLEPFSEVQLKEKDHE